MVYQYCYIMTLMYVFAHIPILRRKRRGIQPQGIQEGLQVCLVPAGINIVFAQYCLFDLEIYDALHFLRIRNH